MDTYDRNVAIIGSAVYGGLLVIGMVLFAMGHSGEPFYHHPSITVAIFSVFWFAFAPSLLFMGATVPWLCVLCGSRAAALTFAVVPGGLFVLVGAFWVMVNDRYQNFSGSPLYVARPLPWSRGAYDGAAYMSGGAPRYSEMEHFPSPAAVAEMMQRGPGPYGVVPPSAWSPSAAHYGGAGAMSYANLNGVDPAMAVGNWSASPPPPPLSLMPPPLPLPTAARAPIYSPSPSLPLSAYGRHHAATMAAPAVMDGGESAMASRSRAAGGEASHPPHGPRAGTYYIA